MAVDFITDGMDINYTDFFYDTVQTSAEAALTTKKGNNDTKEGYIFDVMTTNNLGTMFFCLLPDRVLREQDGVKKPRIFRRVPFGYEGYVTDVTSDKGYKLKIQIPHESDFAIYGNLDGEQRNLLKDLRKKAKDFSELVSYENKNMFPEIAQMISIKEVYQTFFCFAKVLSFNSSAGPSKNPKYPNGLTENELGHVRILKFTKGQSGLSDFGTILNSTLKKRSTALKNVSWIKDYVSRSLGERTKAFCTDVSKTDVKPIRYNMTLSLEEVSPFEITQSDLNIAENLDSAVYDITGFDEKYYNKLAHAFDAVQSKIDKATKIKVAEPPINSSKGAPIHQRKKLEMPQPDFSADEEPPIPTDEDDYPF